MTSLYINSRLLAISYQLTAFSHTFKAVDLKLIAISFILTCVGTFNLSAQACGSCASATCSGIKQYANKAAAQAGIGKVWNYYAPALTNAAGTFTVYATVTTDANGQVAAMQEMQIKGNPTGITAVSQAIAASRTYKLFTMADVSCTSGILPANIANDGTSSTFNPAWTNLLPNTNYKLALTTNVSALGAYTYDGFNIRFYNAVRPVASFAFNCGTASALGTFTANTIAGQTGTLNVPITGATSGAATFNVTGTGFTGSVTTNIAAGQTSVSIPITYDGTGAAGARTLTVTSSQGTGACTPSVSVTPQLSSFAFNCGTASTTGTFTANAITGQTGTITIPLSSATVGQASFAVSGGGFSGSTTTTLTAGQTSVTFPITYNGSGAAGNHLVTITSPQGTGTCALNIPVAVAGGSFAFNCGTASVVGSFIANATTGQSGFVTVPITGAVAGLITINVMGTGITGTLTTTLTNNQTQVTIPITYDGSGAAGARPLSITSSSGTGTCTPSATVTAASTFGAITFNCAATASILGTFKASGAAQTGFMTVGFTTQTAGQVSFAVSGNGFTGNYTGSVVAGQTSVTMPINYDGSGAVGSHALTVTSSQATGTCATAISVQALFDFACANYNTANSFTANGTSQNGTLVIPLSNASAGSATFAVSGNGFTGTLTTVLQDSQRFVAIPVVYDGTGSAGVHAVSVTSSNASGTCSANVMVKDPALDGCDYLLGQSVSFSVNSQSTYTGYSTQYILVDANGVIKYHVAALPFTGVAIGDYAAYAVNFSDTSPNLNVGTNLSAIGGTCANLSNAFPIKMCAAYQFSCGAATYTGVFIANGTGGQTGTLTVTLLNALAIPTTISVSSNGFTGSVTQTLSLGTNTIVIPITYDGTGTGGTKLLPITGTNAVGTCEAGVDVLLSPPASSFAFTCGSAVVNGSFIGDNSLQSGSVTIPLTGVVAGTTNFTVTGTGFSGGLTNVVLTAGQTSITIPVEYNGEGPVGVYPITINSPNATASCMTNVTVTGTCVAGTTAPTLSGTTLSNTCPITTVDLNSLHAGTIPNGARLRWHTVSTNPMATDSVATPSVLATAGTYYAYYFDAIANCYSPVSVAVTVTINTAPAAPTTTVSQPTCAVATGTITVTAPANNVTYSFDNGTTFQATATSNPLATGTYQVRVKDNATNCISTATATIINAQPASPTISSVLKGDPSVSSCPALNDGTISVTANGSNLQYSINNGATWQVSNTFAGLVAGSYTVKVKDNTSTCEVAYTSNPVVLTAPICNLAPTMTSAGTATTPENVSTTTPVYTATSTDPNVGQAPTYSFETGGVDNAKFNIDPITGIVTFITSPDFETPTDADGNSIYEIEVKVCDNGTPQYCATKTVSITVSDVVECPIASVGGITNFAGGALCNTTNSGIITLMGKTGNVVKWQTSINGGASWTDIANTTTTLNFTFANAVNNQQYRGSSEQQWCVYGCQFDGDDNYNIGCCLFNGLYCAKTEYYESLIFRIINSRREYMFIGIYVKMSLNPEGIICKIALYLHTIPSGLRKTLFDFPINIYSLREC